MSRSVKKGPFVDARLLGRIDEMNKRNERKVLKTWSRPSVIFPQMIGHTIAVHDGKRHVPVFVTENMVGHQAHLARADADVLGGGDDTHLLHSYFSAVERSVALPWPR